MQMVWRAGILLSLMFLLFVIGGCRIAEPTTEEESPVITLIKKLLPESPEVRRKKLLEKLSSPDPDLRREGILLLTQDEPAGWTVTPEVLSIMARGDPHPHVRAGALQGLAKLKGNEFLPKTLAAAAKDESTIVQLQCVTVLATQQDNESLDLLTKLLDPQNKTEVRAETALALANYHQQRTLRSLINNLNDEEFAICYQSRKSLQKLTGQDFQYDQQAWRLWLQETPAPFAEGE